MTPTIMHMVGYATPTEYSTQSGRTSWVSAFSFEEIVDPPKNIAGKQCVVNAVYCNYETSKRLSSSNIVNTAYFAWNLNSLWSHLYSSPNTPFLQPALGARDLAVNKYYDLGPRLVRIPEGPFPVKFLCRQQNLDNPLTENYFNNQMASYGSSTYASVTVTAGTNDELGIRTGEGVSAPTTYITIPPGTYATISSFFNAVAPLIPFPYKLRVDGNNTNTRLVIAADANIVPVFQIIGTAASAFGFFFNAVPAKDFIVATVVLHITPVQ